MILAKNPSPPKCIMQKIYFYIHIRTYTYIPFIIAQIFRKICIDSIDLDLQFVQDSAGARSVDNQFLSPCNNK